MKVKLLDSEGKGQGIFAADDIKKGEYHVASGILIPRTSMPQNSELWMYVFSTREGSGDILLLFDWCSRINCAESDKEVNIIYRYIGDGKVVFEAVRDIKKGEEILTSYGYDVVEHARVHHIDIDAWNKKTSSKSK